MAGGDFYVTLPSNASSTTYPDNRISNYRIKLAKALDLRGEWEMALIEIQYPRTWTSFLEADAVFTVTDKPRSRSRKIKMAVGYYPTMAKLIAEVNYLLYKESITLGYDVVINKVYLKKMDPEVSLTFKGRLAQMLGVIPGVAWGTPSESTMGNQPDVTRHYAQYPADIHGGLNTLYIYTDIIEYQAVGDSFVPLLRCVQISGENNDVVTVAFDKGHYVPVCRSHIDDIVIEIKSDQNLDIPFTYGKVVCKLHFRPVKQLFRV